MKLVETRISQGAVYMRYADSEIGEATHWIDFRVPLAELKLPSTTPATEPLAGDSETRLLEGIRRAAPEPPLGELETGSLTEIRLAALRFARDVIDTEAQKLIAAARAKRPY
jgi:hypothetical protein